MKDFIDAYPEIDVTLVVSEDELDVGMREADVAIRMTIRRRPGRSHPAPPDDHAPRRLRRAGLSQASTACRHSPEASSIRPASDHFRLTSMGALGPVSRRSTGCSDAGARSRPAAPQAGAPGSTTSTASTARCERPRHRRRCPTIWSRARQRTWCASCPRLQEARPTTVYFVYPEELRNSQRIMVFP